MSVFVKICGICSRADLEQICALGPDAIGFIFWPNSKRYVRPAQVAKWLPSIPEGIKKVGVFVEPSTEEVEAVARECHLDVIQIHQVSKGWKMERPLFQGLETWLAPKMDAGVSAANLNAVSPEPTTLLADSFDSGKIGGTGTLSDWSTAVELKKIGKPILLAGGLNPDNVAEAIQAVQPWGVDVSSGVEKEPSVKSISKVRKFIESVRS